MSFVHTVQPEPTKVYTLTADWTEMRNSAIPPRHVFSTSCSTCNTSLWRLLPTPGTRTRGMYVHDHVKYSYPPCGRHAIVAATLPSTHRRSLIHGACAWLRHQLRLSAEDAPAELGRDRLATVRQLLVLVVHRPAGERALGPPLALGRGAEEVGQLQVLRMRGGRH